MESEKLRQYIQDATHDLENVSRWVENLEGRLGTVKSDLDPQWAYLELHRSSFCYKEG